MKYRSVIGLEVHIELTTSSKMFCSCSADYFGKPPNSHTCPVCLGLPGVLPVPNQKAIEWCVLAGLALNCQVPLFSKFDRKNYFYPDLAKGYQISQYDQPLCSNGWLKVGESRVGITRVHLEEDTAKMIHQAGVTLIDFNRSGVPLMEVVSEPDIKTPEEAKEYLQKLQQIIRYLGISDCDMEKGSMRCEANISLAKDKKLPDYKVEIKNLNSFKFVAKSLAYEIERQTKLLTAGRQLTQETRGWDEPKQRTFTQRVKETAADYRYFPEPDIPPIRWQKKMIERLRKELPELPAKKAARLSSQYGLTAPQARILSQTQALADYFEEAVKVGRKHGVSVAKLANIIINKKIDIQHYLPARLIKMLVKKQVAQVKDPKQIGAWVKEAIESHQKAVRDYRAGKTAALEFLMGQVQRLAKGRADPEAARGILIKRLK